MRQSLFLYGIHFILVRVFNKAGALVLGRVLDGPAMAVLAVAWFLLLPAAVVASSYAAARILSSMRQPCGGSFPEGGAWTKAS